MICCILGYVYIGMMLLWSKSAYAAVSILESDTRMPVIVIECDSLSYSHVFCASKYKSANSSATIPLDKITPQVKILDVFVVLGDGWHLQKHTMFQNFYNLVKMSIVGLPIYAPSYNAVPNREELTSKLFDLPNLKYLSLWYWNMGSDLWKFPDQLETLILEKCNLNYLSLSPNKKLVVLNASSNNLKKLPQLSDPPPPLERLILSNNSQIEFTVNDIAPLCNLKSLGLTEFNLNFDVTRRYCECKRLRQYMKEFSIKEHDVIFCQSPNNKDDCSTYTLDDARSIHRTKCIKTVPTVESLAENENNSSQLLTQNVSWFDENRFTLGVGFLLLCSAVANVAFVLFIASKRQTAPTSWDPSVSIVEEEGVEI